MKKNLKDKKSLNIAMLGHKRIPSREGGIEIVVEELAARMVTLGHKVTCYILCMNYRFVEIIVMVKSLKRSWISVVLAI